MTSGLQLQRVSSHHPCGCWRWVSQGPLSSVCQQHPRVGYLLQVPGEGGIAGTYIMLDLTSWHGQVITEGTAARSVRNREAPGKASAPEWRIVELPQEVIASQKCSAAWHAKPSAVRPLSPVLLQVSPPFPSTFAYVCYLCLKFLFLVCPLGKLKDYLFATQN